MELDRISAEDRAVLESAYATAQRMRQAEPDRNIARSWVVFEEVAESLLQVYSVATPGVSTVIDMDSIREQVRQEILHEMALDVQPAEAAPEAKRPWWKLLGGG